MGSAAADALARRGRRVLGLDRLAPPHDRGSSHGRTRVIREAYFEHPLYVPLFRRAYELWQELERDSGRTLLRQTGVLSIGPRDGAMLTGTRRSAQAHDIPHQELGPADLRVRWPVLEPPPASAALFESRGGLLFPEACVKALLRRAGGRGAEIVTNQPVIGWSASGRGVEVRAAGARYSAAALIVSAGAWAGSLVPDLALPLTVERQVTHWFAPARDADALRVGRCPVVLWEHEPDRLFYATPDAGDGVKAALHHGGEATSPDDVRPPSPEEGAALHALLARLVPSAAGTLREARTCLYTNTPDGHFVIDRHPAFAQVIIASPCSGHGFKFAPAVGEVLADLVVTGTSRFDLAPFALARFRS